MILALLSSISVKVSTGNKSQNYKLMSADLKQVIRSVSEKSSMLEMGVMFQLRLTKKKLKRKSQLKRKSKMIRVDIVVLKHPTKGLQ